MKKFVLLTIILLAAVSCNNQTKKKVDVSKIDMNVIIDRFEQKFYTTNAQKLPELKNEYPYLFPEQNDSIWLNKIKDEQELFELSQTVFGDFSKEKSQIQDLFKHVKSYHPNFEAPKVITLITNLDYQSKVVYADSLLFVSLDMYLGRDSNVYRDFPLYLSHNFDKSHLVVDIANALIENHSGGVTNRQFIDVMIHEGKKMYLLDCYLPAVSDAEKIGYPLNKNDWVVVNEAQVWKYFIENKLLYSSDNELYSRFISDAPFSKFYIDIDKQSPGKIGVWLGWQIVRSFMDNNDVTLQQLLETPTEEIFKKSKYKPKK
ncbi:MAG: gliding motility lipoprotein GldB [Lutibacter sp.]|uniref:gliding motility lipoprotein GldB n=1 Tax=Lutibacter sp. TaxID=1925666 RepID=UPI0017FEBFA8|nr:gliding motility lipoprotein GldB [Lutibacter sp.]MBT8317364.1 gliding motility lipoprotein GldB [Lutibacter sp.]NNJ58223.1 gliding motility lipoprotein GldB [Lutibacter sp.]